VLRRARDDPRAVRGLPRRAVNAPHLVALVRAGARFECGKLVERDPVLEATQAADDTPVQSPTASNQPVNNAA